MSLLSDIASKPRRIPGSKCTVALTLSSLDDADAGDLRDALTEKRASGEYVYDAEQISVTLHERDIELAPSTINRHRRGGCKCR